MWDNRAKSKKDTIRRVRQRSKSCRIRQSIYFWGRRLNVCVTIYWGQKPKLYTCK